MDYMELKKRMLTQKTEMAPGERMKAYLAGEEVDMIPYTLQLPEPALAQTYGYTTGQYAQDFEVFVDVIKRRDREFGLEGVNQRLSLRSMGAAMGSVLFVPEDGIDSIREHVLQDYKDFDKLQIPDPDHNSILTPMLENARKIKKRFPEQKVTTGVVGPFSTAAAIRPLDQILRDTRKDKDRLNQLLKLGVDASLAWVKRFTDEFGGASASISEPVTCSDILSKKQFDEFSYPHLKYLVDGLTDITGFKPSIHICGHSKSLWNDITDLGVGSFSIDDIEDMEEAKEIMGDKIMIAGNVAPVSVFRYGTIDDVIEATRSCIRKAADSPMGYMLTSGCQIPLGTPRENLDAFLYAARKYGRGARIGELPKGLREE